MKRLLIAALAAFTLLAEEVKKPDAAAPGERALTEVEALKLQLIAAKIQLLQAEIAKLATEQNSVATAACLSLGIPAELVQRECQINTGIGPDGKPVLAKVWWQRATASVATPAPSTIDAPVRK